MLMVLATTAVWYHGDGLYNNYENYRVIIGDAALSAGWWQVLLFIVTFAVLVRPIHRWMNQRFLKRRSHLMLYAETSKLSRRSVQSQIDQLAMAMLTAWLALMAIALIRVEFNFTGLFAPYLGDRASPWGRGRLGGGFSALLSMAGYIQILMAAGFGVLAAVSHNPKTRGIAITVCCLAFPYYLLDRTRNTMLATMLPGILAWVFLRVKGSYLKKGAILFVFFMATNSWFAFVGENRGSGPISRTIRSEMDKEDEAEGEEEEEEEGSKHEGLSMFSELGYLNLFLDEGTYDPPWGMRYYAELANVIPRGLWENKPTIGVDYAIARGFGTDDKDDAGGGINASIATGMIGQGVVNFGRYLGPMAAALLMALWVAILARQDLRGNDPARLLLCGIGMILTFNIGRDITLLVLYPFLFGWLLILALDFSKSQKQEARGSKRVRGGR